MYLSRENEDYQAERSELLTIHAERVAVEMRAVNNEFMGDLDEVRAVNNVNFILLSY